MISTGKGFQKDMKISFQYNKRAAELGNCTGMYNVGFYFEEGLGGVQKDVKMARYWYMKAAKKGYLPAMNKMYPRDAYVSHKYRFDN